jgi:hypothetical protein
MKNISLITKNLYYVSLFNVKVFKNQNKISSLFISCSLRQENFHKTNLYNFIFLLYWLGLNKPVLEVAKQSNAMLKIRKGSLLRFIINYWDLKKIQNLIKNINWFTDKNLNFNNVLTKQNLKKNFIQSIPLNVNIKPSIYKRGNLLFLHSFSISLILHLKVFCKKKQNFSISSL